MSDLHADLTALAGEIEDPRCQRPGMQRRRNWATRIHRALAAHTPPSEPIDMLAKDEQCAQCREYVDEVDGEDLCWECANHRDVVPPSEPATCTCVVGVCREDGEDGCCESPHCPAAPPSSSDADRDTGLSEEEQRLVCICPARKYVAEAGWKHGFQCRQHHRAVECILAARDLARSAQPVGVKKVEYVVDWIRNGPHPTRWTGQQSTFETAEKARDFATWSHVYNPKITRRTTVTKVEPVEEGQS